MTSGTAVKYKSMFDAGSQIVAKEGVKSLFKGAGANILRAVAGAGVLSLYDKAQEVMFGKVYSGGTCLRFFLLFRLLIVIVSFRIRINGFPPRSSLSQLSRIDVIIDSWSSCLLGYLLHFHS